ncbi:hypothetical protein BCV69DRAFT_281730 [Microstroma glucosiphilum]|uniref:BHLH domain-containing protein n=1 Tax=Pseudomicrostroma glucosiphilum TaxID=1684307 RepID=A0A316U9B1_9BASI|nr:hypothetical protein BCV69DRAFT_281730 [Pseudomicrostroma glucosiphilum]PWN21806.1 hypothetical protein BCV69DRAFT_281730 [Pseudomicrostroma glucosiphilum]
MTSGTSSPHPHGSHHQQHLSIDFDLNDFTNLSSGPLSSDIEHYQGPSGSTGHEAGPGPGSVSSASSEGRYPAMSSRQQQQQLPHHHSRAGSTAAVSTSYPSPAESMSRGPASSSNHHSPSQQQHHRGTSSQGSSIPHHPLHSAFSAQGGQTVPQQQQQQQPHSDGSPEDTNPQLSQLLLALSGSAGLPARTEPDPVTHNTAAQMSLQDIQRLLAEKEQSDRLQNLQTALLRQQLEALQRAQQNPQVMSHLHSQHQQKDTMASQSSLQQLLNMLGAGGNGSPTDNASTPQAGGQGQQQFDAHHLLANLLGGNAQQGSSSEYSKMLADSASLLAQYGVLTPPASGGLNMGGTRQQPFMSPLHIPQGAGAGGSGHPNNGFVGMDASGQTRAWDGQMRNQYTPLESPAITPASVFSNMSLGGLSSADQFFSPLTSPALHPTPPQPFFLNNGASSSKKAHGKTTTPSASPLALTGKPGPLPRKNRSTTAEARANRTRPSPLIKPTMSNGNKRKKEVTVAEGPSSTDTPMTATPSGSSSHRRSGTEGGASGSAEGGQAAQQSQASHGAFSTFLPSGATMSMVASPSEGASSTPSPIDLGNNNMGPPGRPADHSKPLTPGSIMGIAGTVKRTSSQRKRVLDSKPAGASSNGSVSAATTKGKARAGQQVSFATAEGAENDEEEDGDDEDADTTKGGAGSSGSPSGGAPDSRRTSHKAAEQKRRDSLKYCFDELRCMLPPITLDEDAPGGSSLGPDGLTEDEEAEGFDRADVMDAEFSRTANRAISKVALLRHSNEWIVRLRNRLARRDEALARSRAEVDSLRALLLANGIGAGIGMGVGVGAGVGVPMGVAVGGVPFPVDSFGGAGAGGGGGGGGGGAGQQQLAQHPHAPVMDWA